MLEMHAIVHGDVHGVGFRATTKRLADGLQLMGFVRNVPDGTVEICAQGDKQELDRLLELLKETFGSQCIRHMDISYREIKKQYQQFTITRL
jgi:acylphosphatase